MEILAILAQVRELLQQQGRLSYRILKMQFQLDDEQLEVLKGELIDIQELALDKEGKMLVWKGEATPATMPITLPPQSHPPPPAHSNTPPPPEPIRPVT